MKVETIINIGIVPKFGSDNRGSHCIYSYRNALPHESKTNSLIGTDFILVRTRVFGLESIRPIYTYDSSCTMISFIDAAKTRLH